MKILDRIEILKTAKWTGTLRVAMENSKITHIGLSNKSDVPTSPIEAEFLPECFFANHIHNFYGTVFYVFDKGIITEYAYSWNFRGELLTEFLGQ